MQSFGHAFQVLIKLYDQYIQKKGYPVLAPRHAHVPPWRSRKRDMVSLSSSGIDQWPIE